MLVLHLSCGGFSMELAEEEVYRLQTMGKSCAHLEAF